MFILLCFNFQITARDTIDFEHRHQFKQILKQRVRKHAEFLLGIGEQDLADFLTIFADAVLKGKPNKTRVAIKALNLNIDHAQDPIQFGLWVMLAESYNQSRLYSKAQLIWEDLLFNAKLI